MESLFSKSILTYKKKIIFTAGVEAFLEYGNQKKNFVTEIQLLFSPFGLPFVPIEIVGTNMNKVITSLAWTKDRSNPGGMLSLELVPDADEIKKMVKIIDSFSGNMYSKIWGELGVDLEDLIKPMTLCQLWINGYHIMTGTVRSVIRNSNVANNEKNVSYTVSIDELGNIYNMNIISHDLIIKDNMFTTISDSIKKSLELSSTIKGVPLSTGIKSLLNAFKLTNLDAGFSMSDGFPLSFRLQASASPLGGIANFSIATAMTIDSALFQIASGNGGMQTMWGFLKNFIPSPWMEFYTESGGRTIVTDTIGAPAALFPGMNYVVARTVPYSNFITGTVNPAHLDKVLPFDLNFFSMLAGGDFIIITDDMIMNKSLGVDCSNQATVFHANYSSGAASGNSANLADRPIKSVGPLNPFASGGIGTFGIREMFQSIDVTNLIGLGSTKAMANRIAKIFGLPTETLSQSALSNLCALWFRNQSRYREGQITCRGLPYARAGMYCLYLPPLGGKKAENLRDIGIYYIDSLSHNYSLNNTELSFTTTLNLIRGTPMPMTLAQSALLLFDFEIMFPMSGLYDGEYQTLLAIRRGISLI